MNERITGERTAATRVAALADGQPGSAPPPGSAAAPGRAVGAVAYFIVRRRVLVPRATEQEKPLARPDRATPDGR